MFDIVTSLFEQQKRLRPEQHVTIDLIHKAFRFGLLISSEYASSNWRAFQVWGGGEQRFGRQSHCDLL
ncbi:MAG: hypothetical protein ACYDBJ_06235 [Aggregatilineales bacterium]